MNTDGVKLEGTDLVPPAEAASRTAAAAVEPPQLGEAREKTPEPEQEADPEGRWGALGLMCLSMVCCLSPWFGATAALPELKEKWSIDDTTAGVLTVMVQLGFLVGACTSAFLAIVRLHSGIASHAAQRSAPSRQRSAPIETATPRRRHLSFSTARRWGQADVVPPRRLFCMGGLGGATANMLLLIPELSFGGACLLRFLTGVAMAFVYPPGMKAAATWFKKGRGLGLGAMVGALCVGSALPNVIVGVRWETVIIATSAVAAFGALLMLVGSDGPFPFKGVSHFQCALVGKCLVSTASSWKRDFFRRAGFSLHGAAAAQQRHDAGDRRVHLP